MLAPAQFDHVPDLDAKRRTFKPTMKCAVNKKLLPVKLHYFFFFGGVAPILPFLTVYARQLGITEMGMSAIYLLLPVVSGFLRPTAGWLADCTGRHKTVFLSMLVITTLGYMALYFIPPLPTGATSSPDSPPSAHVDLLCADSLMVRVCDRCSAERLMPHTAGSNSSAACRLSCEPAPADCAGAAWCQANASLSLDLQLNVAAAAREGDCVLWPLADGEMSVQGAVVQNPHCPERAVTPCRISCPDSSIVQLMDGKVVERGPYRAALQFWLFVALVIPAWVGTSLCVPLADAIAFKMLDDPNRYGYERCWGSIGWGIFSFLAGYLVDSFSAGSSVKDYTPAFILLVFLMVVDIVVCSRLQMVELYDVRPDFWSGIGPLVKRPQVLVFLFSCCVVGVLTGVLWTYSFLYIQDLARLWDCRSFEWVSVISGLTLFIQCFFGELPFFFFSAWIIKRLGPVYTQTLVLFSFGVRFLLYSIITNPWLILPVELLNGLTFGLFYANMVVYAGEIAPPGMVATLQGMVGAMFECVGVAIGGGTGGMLYFNIGGAGMYQVYGGVALVSCALYALMQCCLRRYRSGGDSSSAVNTVPDSLAPRRQTASDALGSELQGIKHIDDDDSFGKHSIDT